MEQVSHWKLVTIVERLLQLYTYAENRNHIGGISEFRDYPALFQDTDPFLQDILELGTGRLNQGKRRILYCKDSDGITYERNRQNRNASS